MKQMSWKQIVAIVAAISVAFAIGLVVAGRANRDDSAASAAPPGADAASSSTSTTAPGAIDPGAPVGSVVTPDGGALGDGASGGAGALEVVEPAAPVDWAYNEPGNAEQETGTTLPPKPLVQVSMSSTQDLQDGQNIAIRVTPPAGSDSRIFGFDARVCQRDAPIRNMYDYFPTVSGYCASNPLSAGSDAHIQVAGAEPYQQVDMNFRAGVGSDSFTTDQGNGVTITCNSSHPCDLVLWIQVPYGFVFEHFPLTFA